MERQIIKASSGMILTNGEIYGKTIYLAETDSADNYYEITDEEYWELQAEGEEFPND